MLEIGKRLELFVDRHLIEALQGVVLKLHHPQPAGVALKLDAPWEGPFSIYTTVLQDGGRFLMYYRGLPAAKGERALASICLATSKDGIAWTKPNLGLYEVFGIRENNVVLRDDKGVCHNFSPFIDKRPGVPEGERFKGAGGSYKHGGLFGYVSGDGIHWRKIKEEPILTYPSFAFDSQNVPFWSEAEGCYLFYFRTFHPSPESKTKYGFRWVSRCTSEDFIHWSEPVEMDPCGAPYEEIYTQQTHPYFRAPHIYISLAARFWPGRQVITEAQARELGIIEPYWQDCSDTVLMTSRGGNRYDRTFMESFIRPGVGPEHWSSRSNYAALGVVPTGPAEMSLYVNRRYAQQSSYVERMTLRTDGFASLSAPYRGGEALTKPLRFAGRKLVINYSTSAAGNVRVEIQDAHGRPIPGFALEDCPEIIGDEIARVVTWRNGADVSSLAGEPVRLRFVMKDADLFSLRFQP